MIPENPVILHSTEPTTTNLSDIASQLDAKDITNAMDFTSLPPSFWSNFINRQGKHAKARAARAKSRIAKRKSKR